MHRRNSSVRGLPRRRRHGVKNALTSKRRSSLPCGGYFLACQLPDVFAQEKVWSFMLGVGGRANTSLYDASRSTVARMFGPAPSSKREGVGEGNGASSTAKPPSGLIHQDALPELMRMQKYIER